MLREKLQDKPQTQCSVVCEMLRLQSLWSKEGALILQLLPKRGSFMILEQYPLFKGQWNPGSYKYPSFNTREASVNTECSKSQPLYNGKHGFLRKGLPTTKCCIVNDKKVILVLLQEFAFHWHNLWNLFKIADYKINCLFHF